MLALLCYRGRTPHRCELLLTFLLARPVGLMVSRLLLSKVSVALRRRCFGTACVTVIGSEGIAQISFDSR